MPVITIYLNEQMWEFVKQDKSRIIQKAIKELMAKPTPLPAGSADAPSYQINQPITNTPAQSG